jgi:iron-sulfur cluster assembly protein
MAMFTLTRAAAQQIQQAAAASAAQDLALRIAACQAADGSIDYGMGFDEAQDEDLRLLLEGVAVVIADPHQPLLEDTTLDFVELEPGEFNFIFIPAGTETPAAAPATGGCGSGGCVGGGCGGGSGGG